MKDQPPSLKLSQVSVLDNLPHCSSALARAEQLIEKTRAVGLDWPSVDGVFSKIEEEIQEIHDAINEQASRAHLEEEIGNLFLVCLVLCRWCHVSLENALYRHNEKFIQRFRALEQHLNTQGSSVQTAAFEALEEAWQEAKESVAVNKAGKE
jgi:uncharacterized protein YabN with tetrapyrrole methylase and pyrophosphatase domain